MLENITDELIESDWAPKVYGAWNLHKATAAQPLDWFCSFSSIAALVGSPGQGAYAAANSWLDAFSHWRRAQGLPATAIAWGAWATIGRATAVADAARNSDHSERGRVRIRRTAATRPRVRRLCAAHRLRPGSPLSRNVAGSLNGSVPQPKAPWAQANCLTNCTACRPEEWPIRLRRLISEQVSTILRRTIDPDRPLSEYGLDSLGNLELRTHIEAETRVRITSTDITTIQGFGGSALRKADVAGNHLGIVMTYDLKTDRPTAKGPRAKEKTC